MSLWVSAEAPGSLGQDSTTPQDRVLLPGVLQPCLPFIPNTLPKLKSMQMNTGPCSVEPKGMLCAYNSYHCGARHNLAVQAKCRVFLCLWRADTPGSQGQATSCAIWYKVDSDFIFKHAFLLELFFLGHQCVLSSDLLHFSPPFPCFFL